MSAPPDIRSQLRTLAIPKDLRPTGEEAARRRPRIGRWIVSIIFLGILGVGGYAGYQQRDRILSIVTPNTSTPDLKLLTVTARRSDETSPVLTATGKIVSDHLVQVATKVSGQIISLHFEQGDRVDKGRVLARIEDVISRARRDEAAATLEKSKANLDYQRINFDRVLKLHQAADAMDIEYADAKRAVAEGEAQVAADAAALEYSEKALHDCEVTAPIAGVILERNVEVGDFVSAEGGRGAMANSQFASIADMSKLRVEIDISELDIARIRKGMICRVTPDAYKDRRYEGEVMWLDPGANYSKATVQAKVRIKNPDEYLRVEGSAQVVFLEDALPSDVASSSPSIWIPASACRIDPSGETGKVFVVLEDRLVETNIIFGRRVGNDIEVRFGLTEGQTLVADGVEKLSDGRRIRTSE